MTWLVAGLGNPGEPYAKTRHNLGYRVVDELAARESERFRKARFVGADVADIRVGTERVLLAKSRAFMNESGPAISSLANKHDAEPDHVIAVHDEIDLPFGALRVKFGGSTAGHNGLRSLQQALRTPDFFRIRLGVGRPTGRKQAARRVSPRREHGALGSARPAAGGDRPARDRERRKSGLPGRVQGW